MNNKKVSIVLAFLFLLLPSVFGAQKEGFADPVFYLKATTILLVIVTVIIIVGKNSLTDNHKTFFFWLIAAPVLLSTLYLAGATVHENFISETKGPIHWHADYQVWACDKELDLIDPTGLKNKIGSPLFHEHNDNRVHVEGTVIDIDTVNFQAYFAIVGGELTNDKFSYDVEGEGLQTYKNGDLCNGIPGEVGIYVNGQRIDNIDEYMYYPHALVPPGDCVIIEFGVNLPEATQRICTSWAANEWSYDNYRELRKEYKPWSSEEMYYDEELHKFVEVSE